MQEALDLLVPRPLEMTLLEEELHLPARLTIHDAVTEDISEDSSAAGRWLSTELERLGFEIGRGCERQCHGRIHLCMDGSRPRPDAHNHDQSYRLEVRARGIELTAGSPRGLFYGVATLAQWLELHRESAGARPRRCPGLRVRDRPSFPVRGVMLDISRDKVPRIHTLFALIDMFARLKINQLQLYMEHTFAYRDHGEVWRDASPLTTDDVRRLDDYCAERCIDLVPNQQSFGHFHRWLVHPSYRRLAECPDGIAHPFALDPEPFSLCPLDPRSLDLLADLYDQLLPSFRHNSRRAALLNVGCDETLDLGLGRSKAACDQHGKTRVYLDFLRRVHGLAAERGHRIQIWGDIILQHPELIGELPEDVIALEWGYEADHPFEQDCRHFAASGREFYVCPGTSTWNSFAGRTENALGNLASAAVHGHDHGASGYLITDWGDFGHLQQLPASYPGFLAGAAFAWNVESAHDPSALPLASLLDRHVFRDRSGVAGRVVTELGNTYLRLSPTPRNGSALFFLVIFALLDREAERTEGVTLRNLEAALEHVESSVAALTWMKSELADADLLTREIAWSADIQTFACRLGCDRWREHQKSIAHIPLGQRRALARELRGLIEDHRGIFLDRNRLGGWKRSSNWLKRVLAMLESTS